MAGISLWRQAKASNLCQQDCRAVSPSRQAGCGHVSPLLKIHFSKNKIINSVPWSLILHDSGLVSCHTCHQHNSLFSAPGCRNLLSARGLWNWLFPLPEKAIVHPLCSGSGQMSLLCQLLLLSLPPSLIIRHHFFLHKEMTRAD